MLGAFGHLHCLDVATGRLQWACHLSLEFDAAMPHWGYASSPLLADGKLIVQPGGAEASLVALDPATGDIIWESPGGKAAYAGFIAVKLHGSMQIIGCDQGSFGGWDAASGRRLWKLVPEDGGEFFVPAPVMLGTRLLLAGEYHGSRLHDFDAAGQLAPQPLAHTDELAPDAHTPVPVGNRMMGLGQKFCCFDAVTLKPIWSITEADMGTYASMISDGRERVLSLSERGVLFLHDVSKAEPVELGRLRICLSSAHVLSHPALVGSRLYVRFGDSVACLKL